MTNQKHSGQSKRQAINQQKSQAQQIPISEDITAQILGESKPLQDGEAESTAQLSQRPESKCNRQYEGSFSTYHSTDVSHGADFESARQFWSILRACSECT